jgi:spermidine/putrescine-binding protein
MSIRKNILIALSLLVVAGLILAACTPQPTEPPPPQATEAPTVPPPAEAPTEPPAETVSGQLVMLDWAGYEIPEFWGEFATKYPDVKVEFSFLTESAEVYSKLQSGFEADLVHPCSNFWKLLVDENMVQPIDTSKLSHWDSVIDSLAKEGEFNGKQYWIPWDWGFESVLVRKDLVENVPTSWADIWKPEYAGHISINDSGEAAHIWASLALGLDPWNQTDAEYEQVKQKLIDLAPSVLAYWTGQTDLDQMLASGDVWLGVGAWNASYVSLLDQGLDVEYINPVEGRTGYLCGFGIPTTSKNVELAHAMIDAYLAIDSMVYLANEYGYGIANGDAIPEVDPKMSELLGLTDQSVIDKTIFYKSITPEQRELWTNTWSEVKTSQ